MCPYDPNATVILQYHDADLHHYEERFLTAEEGCIWADQHLGMGDVMLAFFDAETGDNILF